MTIHLHTVLILCLYLSTPDKLAGFQVFTLTHTMKPASLPLISGSLSACWPRMSSPLVPFRLT